jgi:hypothetical protein
MSDKAKRAVDRMLEMVGLDYPYELGTGSYDGEPLHGPWDCIGAILDAYRIKRHRPGYARGALPNAWAKFADVVDDINSNSMIKDALIKQELFYFVTHEEPLRGGDVLVYPTIIVVDADDGERHRFTGHGQMVIEPNGVVSGGPYSAATIAHSSGPNGRRPAVRLGTAKAMDRHNEVWPKNVHRAWALRAIA